MGRSCIIVRESVGTPIEREGDRYSLYCNPAAEPIEVIHDLLDFQERNKLNIKRLVQTRQSIIKERSILMKSYQATEYEQEGRNLDILLKWLYDEIDKQYKIEYLLKCEIQNVKPKLSK